jgi:hypothetical protein
MSGRSTLDLAKPSILLHVDLAKPFVLLHVDLAELVIAKPSVLLHVDLAKLSYFCHCTVGLAPQVFLLVQHGPLHAVI